MFEGRLFIESSSFIINSSGTSTKFGTIGILTELCINAQISNVQIYFTVKSNVGSYNSPLIGYQKAINCSIINVSIYNSTMNSSYYCGGLFGVTWNNITITNNSVIGSNFTCGSAVSGIICVISAKSNITIINQLINSCTLNSGDYAGAMVGTVELINQNGLQNPYIQINNFTLSNTNITCIKYAGGLVASVQTQSQFIFNSLIIRNIRVQGQYYGFLVGYNMYNSQFVIQSSQSQGENYVNGIKQINCDQLMNINGC
ncbi:Hypothetical_protein [Hexamita inflata]|nr:Hypothetical protein HINF_LOCUS47673 [Hexamita inflata]